MVNTRVITPLIVVAVVVAGINFTVFLSFSDIPAGQFGVITQALPDLTIEQITYTVGNEITATGTLTNTGLATVSVAAYRCSLQTPSGSQEEVFSLSSPLYPDTTLVQSCSFTKTPGPYQLTFDLDPHNAIREQNEQNNALSVIFKAS